MIEGVGPSGPAGDRWLGRRKSQRTVLRHPGRNVGHGHRRRVGAGNCRAPAEQGILDGGRQLDADLAAGKMELLAARHASKVRADRSLTPPRIAAARVRGITNRSRRSHLLGAHGLEAQRSATTRRERYPVATDLAHLWHTKILFIGTKRVQQLETATHYRQIVAHVRRALTCAFSRTCKSAATPGATLCGIQDALGARRRSCRLGLHDTSLALADGSRVVLTRSLTAGRRPLAAGCRRPSDKPRLPPAAAEVAHKPPSHGRATTSVSGPHPPPRNRIRSKHRGRVIGTHRHRGDPASSCRDRCLRREDATLHPRHVGDVPRGGPRRNIAGGVADGRHAVDRSGAGRSRASCSSDSRCASVSDRRTWTSSNATSWRRKGVDGARASSNDNCCPATRQ